jgi:uncharacterized protein YndB with AHSA1/START domain
MKGPSDAATTSEVAIPAPPERVFDALTDARTYPDWLVGAKRIRAIDDDWPAVGTAFHHTVGAGPLVLHDKTTMLHVDPPYEIRLRAGIGALGAAVVRFTLTPDDRGSRVEFTEEPERGLVRLGWRSIGRPLLRLGLWGRNAASLERLANHLEGQRPSREGPTA